MYLKNIIIIKYFSDLLYETLSHKVYIYFTLIIHKALLIEDYEV